MFAAHHVPEVSPWPRLDEGRTANEEGGYPFLAYSEKEMKMGIECPDCKDVSKYATDCYKPYCKIACKEIDRSHFEGYCKRYPGYQNCPIRRRHYDR